MSDAIPVTGKRRGRPKVNATQLGVRLTHAELAALDAWIALQPDPKPTRPEALRLAAREKFAKA